MRAEGISYGNRAALLEPAVVSTHPDDVAYVEVRGHGLLFVRYHDGTTGTIDLTRLIASSKAGVFAQLKDSEVFAQVEVVMGVVTWPGEIDLAPDSMYEALRRDGEWILPE